MRQISILCCPYTLSFEQYSIINILWVIFSEFLRIARCTLRLINFVPKPLQLYARKIRKSENKSSIPREIKKAFQRYPETFSMYCTTYD